MHYYIVVNNTRGLCDRQSYEEKLSWLTAIQRRALHPNEVPPVSFCSHTSILAVTEYAPKAPSCFLDELWHCVEMDHLVAGSFRHYHQLGVNALVLHGVRDGELSRPLLLSVSSLSNLKPNIFQRLTKRQGQRRRLPSLSRLNLSRGRKRPLSR